MAWDMTVTKQQAVNAAQGIELEVDSVHNNPTQGHIHFKNNRVSHAEMKKFTSQLNTDFEYSKVQVTSHAKDMSPFNRFVEDGGEFTFTTRTYGIVQQNRGIPSEQDVGSVFSELTQVMDLASARGKVVFGTHVVFMEHADEAIEDLGIDSERLLYASKLLEIEDKILGGTA